MNLHHVGLTASSEENADRFYGELLGLRKLEPKTLPASLSRALFDIDADLTMVNYVGDAAHFEIFIVPVDIIPRETRDTQGVAHSCLAVDDLGGFLERCRAAKADVKQVPKGNSVITFVQDHDGNLFEIKAN